MGEMLAKTERANAARDKKKAELPDVTPPTLKEIGLTKRESAEASIHPPKHRTPGLQFFCNLVPSSTCNAKNCG